LERVIQVLGEMAVKKAALEVGESKWRSLLKGTAIN
jgi:hypothetical protein